MSQITLYLDDATQALVEQAAAASGMSKSRWVAEMVRKYAAYEWPQGFKELAGRFADFPLTEQLSDSASTATAGGTLPPDVPRLGF